jgi:hypothetical protein
MKKPIFYLLVLVILLFGLSAYFLVPRYYVPTNVHLEEFDVHITSRVTAGLNLDKDMMHFGAICSTCRATRSFTITNNDTFSQRIEIFIVYSNENMSADWFTLSPTQKLVLGENEEQEFKIVLQATPDTPYGKYEGYVYTKVYRALPWE